MAASQPDHVLRVPMFGNFVGQNLTVVEIKEVRRGVVGVESREIFRAEVRVRLFSRQDSEDEREIRVIAAQQVQPAEIVSIGARHRRKVSIQLVVGFGEQVAVEIGEDARELANHAMDYEFLLIVENNSQRKAPE